jgi:hypothetical protein
MTAQELRDNCIAHNACAEGLVWLAGKDGDAFWASTDEMATPYLFWWVVQNVDSPGCKSRQDVLNILQEIYSQTKFHFHPIDINGSDFSEQVLHRYALIELRMGYISELSKFRLSILPLVQQLRGTI